MKPLKICGPAGGWGAQDEVKRENWLVFNGWWSVWHWRHRYWYDSDSCTLLESVNTWSPWGTSWYGIHAGTSWYGIHLHVLISLVAAQIERLISANEWGVTTEFWHFDFSAYLKHSTYGIMGSYRTFVHYVRTNKKRIPIGVIRPKIRVKNLRRGATPVCSAVEWRCYASPDREGLASYLLDI